ncbi:hypothetical protein LZ30DRAFT_387180 [Colletotrichum cereale]|nr:hypothetical protein LZ30DRAFT_387180 [Colletotrichum cereale]
MAAGPPPSSSNQGSPRVPRYTTDKFFFNAATGYGVPAATLYVGQIGDIIPPHPLALGIGIGPYLKLFPHALQLANIGREATEWLDSLDSLNRRAPPRLFPSSARSALCSQTAQYDVPSSQSYNRCQRAQGTLTEYCCVLPSSEAVASFGWRNERDRLPSLDAADPSASPGRTKTRPRSASDHGNRPKLLTKDAD